MSERNKIKPRKCQKCCTTLHCKAHGLKEHAKECDGKKTPEILLPETSIQHGVA